MESFQDGSRVLIIDVSFKRKHIGEWTPKLFELWELFN